MTAVPIINLFSFWFRAVIVWCICFLLQRRGLNRTVIRFRNSRNSLKPSVNLHEIAARLPLTPHPEIVSLYAQLIGELMFIGVNTHPLIAQPVNALARFMTTANSEFYVLVKGVLRYLEGVKSRKIVWCAAHVKFPFVPCEIYAYSDASWADVVPNAKALEAI